MKRALVVATLFAATLAFGQSYAPSGGGDSLPSQSTHSGQYLGTDGTTASWSAISGTLSGGTSGRVAYWTSATALGSTASFTWDGSTLAITGAQTLSGNLTVNSLTSGRVPYASTSGLLIDSGNLTFNGSTLTLTGAQSVSGNLTVGSLTSGRVPYASTAGLLVDSANLTFNGSTLALTGAQTISGLLSSSVASGSIGFQLTTGALISFNGATGTIFCNGVASNNGLYCKSPATTGTSFILDGTGASGGMRLLDIKNASGLQAYFDGLGSFITNSSIQTAAGGSGVTLMLSEGAKLGLDGAGGNEYFQASTSTHGILFQAATTNSGSNSAFTHNTSVTLSGSTFLDKWTNNGTLKVDIENDGSIDITSAFQSTTSAGAGAFYQTEGSIICHDGTTCHTRTYGLAATHNWFATSNVTNSSTNTGFVLDTWNALTGSTLLLDIQNADVSKFTVEDDGTANAFGFHATSSTHAGTITLAAATTGTATVVSGCKPLCTNTTNPTAVQCTVASTTLTATEVLSSSDAINYFCF